MNSVRYRYFCTIHSIKLIKSNLHIIPFISIHFQLKFYDTYSIHVMRLNLSCVRIEWEIDSMQHIPPLKEKAPFDWQQTFIHIKIRKCLQINHKAAARTQLLKTVTAHTAEVTLCDSGNNKTDFYCIMPGLFSLKIIKIWHIKANNTIYVCGSDSKTNLQIFSWFPLKILWL